jgi:hypothetical protein
VTADNSSSAINIAENSIAIEYQNITGAYKLFKD